MNANRSKLIELVVRAEVSDENVEKAIKVISGESHDVLDDRYLSIKEAIKYSTLSRITLWTHRKNGRLKFYRIGGRVLLRKNDLDSLIAG